MANNMAFSTGEGQVNRVDPLDATNGLAGSQLDQEVTVLGNGNFLIVYENPYAGGSNYDVLGVELNPDTIVNGPFHIDAIGSTAGSFGQFDPDIAPAIATPGSWAAVWQDQDVGGSASADISFVVSSGAPNNPAEKTIANETQPLRNPTIAMFANGNYIVAYERDFGGGNHDVNYVTVNPAGTVLTGPVNVVASAADQFDPVAAASGANSVIVWTDSALAGSSSQDIMLRRVSNAGVAGANLTVADATGTLFQPDVAALSDGRFVIVWAAGGVSDLAGRIYDPTTDALGPIFTVSSRGGFQSEPRVAGLPDGGFFVTWTDDSRQFSDHSDEAIAGRRFDSTGTFAGDDFQINVGTTNVQFGSAIAANAAGQVFATWATFGTDSTTDASPTGVQGRFLAPTIDTVSGGAGNDSLLGYTLGEPINGNAGDDEVHAGAGADTATGGDGNDVLFGEDGNDVIGGNAGNDVAFGGAGSDLVGGDDGNDALYGEGGTDTLFGGAGADALNGGDGNDIMVGDDGNDLIIGEAGNDIANGGTGDDVVSGGDGNDVLGGGSGNDAINGDAGDDFLFGEDGNDSLTGGDGNDGVAGGSGDDLLEGRAGADTFIGGDGNDTVNGGDGDDLGNGNAGNDTLNCGAGNDVMGGATGNDTVNGNDGDDLLFGEEDNDTLAGGTGNDTLVGGANNDTFVFSPGDGADTITDFAAGGPDDVIQLVGTSLGSFAAVLAAATTVGGNAVITYNGANTITITGVAPGALTAADFSFA